MKTVFERLRLCHVKRWHIVRVAREQTVAEHSYSVWVIVDDLLKFTDFTNSERRLALDWALVHDEPEALFGDIPTPAKVASDKLGVAADELNRSCSRWATLKNKCDNENKAICQLVKLADITEAVWFLRQEGIGYHAAEVLALLRKQLREAFNNALFFTDKAGAESHISILAGGM